MLLTPLPHGVSGGGILSSNTEMTKLSPQGMVPSDLLTEFNRIVWKENWKTMELSNRVSFEAFLKTLSLQLKTT